MTYREGPPWILISSSIILVGSAILAYRWFVEVRSPQVIASAEERIAAASERIADALSRNDPSRSASAALAGMADWSLMLYQDRGGCSATLIVDGVEHHGHGGELDEAEAAAIRSWRATQAGAKSAGP